MVQRAVEMLNPLGNRMPGVSFPGACRVLREPADWGRGVWVVMPCAAIGCTDFVMGFIKKGGGGGWFRFVLLLVLLFGLSMT